MNLMDVRWKELSRRLLPQIYLGALTLSMVFTTATTLLYPWPYFYFIRIWIFRLSLFTSLMTYVGLILQTYGKPSLTTDYWTSIFQDDIFKKAYFCALFLRGHVRNIVLLPLFLDEVVAMTIYHLNYIMKAAPSYAALFRPIHMFVLLRKYKIFYVTVFVEIVMFPYLLIELVCRREIISVGVCIAYAQFLVMRSSSDLVLHVWSGIQHAAHEYLIQKWYVPVTIKIIVEIVEDIVVSFSYYNDES